MKKAIETMTPAEIDAVLADLWDRSSATSRDLGFIQRQIDRKQYGSPAFLQSLVDQVERLRATLRALDAEAAPYNAEYLRRGWNRYFLVVNGNGHVHRGRNCSTCFPTTRYGWLIVLSGCDEKAMVAEYGEKACTVCFPDAPSLYVMLGGKSRIETREAEAKAERQAAREARAAEKAAKAIANPDGSILRDRGNDRIETLATAKMRLTDHVDSLARGGQPGSYFEAHRAEYVEARDRIAAAIAAKLGTTVEIEIAAAKKRAKGRK